MAGLVNKTKDAIDKMIHPEHKDAAHNTAGTTGTGVTGSSTATGSHGSNLANTADPRVDSGTHHGTGGNFATGSTTHPGHATGHTGTGSMVHGSTVHGSTNAGPHSSNLANTADPRVDSDMDGSRNMGMSSGYGSSTTGGYGSQTAGPHSSNLANKADPRVDSDLDGSNTYGSTTGTYGSTTGTYGSTTATTGTAGSGTVGSGTAGSGTTGSGLGTHGTTHGTHGAGMTGSSTGGVLGGSGPGPAPNTAGPHSSDLLNKADPRVDSDLDGSKTVGGNKTYTSDDDEPLDAAKHSPSVFRHRSSNDMQPGETDHHQRHAGKKGSTAGTLENYGPGHQ